MDCSAATHFSVCQENRPVQRHETLKPSEMPSRPWSEVGTDLLEYKGKMYLMAVDKYSRLLKSLSSTSSAAIINHIKNIISAHGVIDVLTSDNGSQCVSSEFNQFAKMCGFHHITSSPHFPQANGEAASAVRTDPLTGRPSPGTSQLLKYATFHPRSKSCRGPDGTPSSDMPPDDIEEEPDQPEQVAIPNMATPEIAPRPDPAATPPTQGRPRRITKRPDRLIEKC